MGKIIIIERNEKLILFLLDDKNLPTFIQSALLPGDEGILGNIYIAKVTEVVKGLQAVFVSIDNGQKAFLPMTECVEPMLVNREYDGQLKQGDEIVIQISSQAVKTKLPGATTKLTLPGKYCVCNINGHGIAYSKKLSKKTIVEIKTAVMSERKRKKYAFTIRTNAGMLEDYSLLMKEMQQQIDFFDELTKIYKYRTCFTCLRKAEPEILSVIKNIPLDEYKEVITDSLDVYSLLKPYEISGLKFYQNDTVTLSVLYSLEMHLKQALSSKVWLPGGGYLVIEPTEAMVVIDVNSGKGSNCKSGSKQNVYFRTNWEAAAEIARQLRLRNYSGMIMVDFINMESDEDNKKLLDFLRDNLQKDKVKTRLVDMTALGIVEITRKKVSKPLDISIL